MSSVDYDTADRTEVANTFKTKKVAERHTREYTGLAAADGLPREPGEVFEVSHWTGQKSVPAWCAYDLKQVDGTWVITSYLWCTNPVREECQHCGATIVAVEARNPVHPDHGPMVEWHDEKRHPAYCPKALNLNHEPKVGA